MIRQIINLPLLLFVILFAIGCRQSYHFHLLVLSLIYFSLLLLSPYMHIYFFLPFIILFVIVPLFSFLYTYFFLSVKQLFLLFFATFVFFKLFYNFPYFLISFVLASSVSLLVSSDHFFLPFFLFVFLFPFWMSCFHVC